MCHQSSYRPDRIRTAMLQCRSTFMLNNQIYMPDFMQDSHLLMGPLLKSPPSHAGKRPTRSLFTRTVESINVFISNLLLLTLEKSKLFSCRSGKFERRCLSKFRMDENSKVQSGSKGDRDRKPGGWGGGLPLILVHVCSAAFLQGFLVSFSRHQQVHSQGSDTNGSVKGAYGLWPG